MIIRRILLSLLGLIILLCVAVFYIGTESGTQFIWSTLSKQFPEKISASKLEGKLSDKLRFENLKISLDNMEITASNLEFDWQPSGLINTKLIPQLIINLIKIDDLKINQKTISEKTPSNEPIELPNIKLPVVINLKKFILNNTEYSAPESEPVKIEKVSFGLYADQKNIQLDQFQLVMKEKDLAINTEISGVVQPHDFYPLDFDIKWNVKLPDMPELNGAGKLKGDLENLVIDQKLSSPVNVLLNANINKLLSDLTWLATLGTTQLQLQNINSDLPDVLLSTEIKANGDLEKINILADYQIASIEFGEWDGNISLDQKSSSEITINNFNIKSKDSETYFDLKGDVKLSEIPKFNLHGNWNQLRWPLNGDADVKSKQGEYKFSGSAEDYQLNVITNVFQKDVGEIKIDLDGHGDDQKFTIKNLITDLLSGQIKSEGVVNWGSTPLTFDFSSNWTNINWQKTSEENTQSIKSPQGKFKINGQADNYNLSLETSLSQEELSIGNLIVSGKGTDTEFDLSSLHADIFDGEIDLVGKVAWGEKISWDFQLDSKNIDPGKLEETWPGKLNIASKVSGQKVGDQLSAKIENTSISGQLRGYTINAETNIELLNDLIDINSFKLSSGQSVMMASGQAGQKFDLTWSLNSPNLNEIIPDASGQLNAQGTVKGTSSSPSIQATLEGIGLKMPDIEIGKLSSKINFDLPNKDNEAKNADQNFDIQLNSSQLVFGANLIDSVDLISSGSLASHTIKADVKQDKNMIAFLTKGGLKDDLWSGVIQELSLNEERLGQWSLLKPQNLTASKQKIDLEKLCLSQEQAKICSELHWKAESGWQTNAELDQIPFSLLSSFLPADMIMNGASSTTLVASGAGVKNILAKLELKTSSGSITLPNPDNKTRFEFKPSTVEVVMDKNSTKATMFFDLAQPTDSLIKATIETNAFDPAVDFKTLPLKGRLTTRIDDLAFIEAFTAEVEDLSGNIDIDLQIAGTVGKPEIKGHTKLTAEVFLPAASIKLQDIKLDVSSKDTENFTINGHLKSGKGKLDLKGNISLAGLATEEGISVEAEIKGDRFEVVNLPEAWVVASPSLKIISQKNNLNIVGEITIPEALLEPQGIASSVPISEDIVILDEQTDQKESTDGMQITADVKLILGNKVSITSSGFSGSLKGDLTAISTPGEATTGTGEINIRNGQFSAYGQQLKIEKGKILFAGGPIDSPELDLKAIRKIKSITAGVHVTGPATEPELTLFSKPNMNQDDILSYIMIGSPLSEASSEDSQLLIGAASSLGFKGGAMLTQNIGQSLGLDEFSIDGSGAEDASLKVGKYLTPKLYISYGMGIFDSVTKLKMRYDLSKRWSVEADSGTNSGMDFLYKIEK